MPFHAAANASIDQKQAPNLSESLAEVRDLVRKLQPDQHGNALRAAWGRLDAALAGPADFACTQDRPGSILEPLGKSAGAPELPASRGASLASLLRNVFAARTAQAGVAAAPAPPEEMDLLRSLLANSLEGVYRRNLRSNSYDYLSPALEQITGIPLGRFARLGPDELVDLMHPDDRQSARGKLALPCLQEQGAGVLEYRLPSPDGTYRWCSDSYRLIRDDEGRPEYLVGNLRDISAAKHAVASASNSEETLRALIELMPVGVCLVNFDGRFQYLNRFFLDSFGYDLSDIPTVQDWFLKAYPDPEYRAKVISVFRTDPGGTLENGAPVPLRETAVTCKDGSVRQVIFNRQLAQDYRVIILTDVTEREKLRNELLKLQKLETLGVLAGGIAHDFNNILTGIVGNISLARLLFDAHDWSSELLESAASESERAAKLAAQLLTFAKGGTPVKGLVSVPKVLNDALSFALAGANVDCAATIPESLHAIEADQGQLGQAFHNIISNALQAMPDGGTLTVAAENLPIGPESGELLPPGSYLRISFSDRGPGIAPQHLARVFDPYFSTKPGCAGLGLATAHSIVTRHGGNLSARSEAGGGACLTVLLPSTGVPLPESPPRRKAAGADYGAGGAILLMDDEKTIRAIASKMLECLSFQVTVCSSGEEAIALYRSALDAGTPYRLVVMDLTVACGMGGEEAARHILSLDPTARLIVSSGYSNDPVLADYRRYGFQAAMPKPYKLSDMEEVLGSFS